LNNGGAIRPTIWMGTMGNLFPSTISVKANEWNHIAIQRDNGIWKMYFNSQEVVLDSTTTNTNTTITTAPNSPSGVTSIGSFLGQGTGHHGSIAEVTIWEKALSSSEIKKLMSSAPNLEDDSLVGYWPLNEGDGEIVKDYSYNGNDGTITGATWINTAPTIYGEHIYTSDNINSWQKAVGLNLSSPSWLFTDSQSFLATNELRGLFLHGYKNSENAIWIADTSNQLNQMIDVISYSNPTYLPFPTENYMMNGFAQNGYDEFTFTLDTAQKVELYTSGDEYTDTHGILYDANGTVVALNEDYSVSDLNFRIVADLAAGTYRLKVSGRDESDGVEFYTLNIVAKNISREVYPQPFNQIVYSSDGRYIFGTDEPSSFISRINQFDLDSNTTLSSYTYPKQYEVLKDMVRIGNYIVASSTISDYNANITTVYLKTFNENNISAGPIATLNQTFSFSSGGQIEAKLAYANGKLALIGGYDKNNIWVFDATDPTNLIQGGEVSLPSEYPSKCCY
jgi:hypothetical protein